MTHLAISELRPGDLHLVTSSTYEKHLKEALSQQTSGIAPIVTIRYDDKPGTHALRPYINIDIVEALKMTAILLKESDIPDLVLLSKLCHTLSETHVAQGNARAVGAFDDVILELQYGNIEQFLQTLPLGHPHRNELEDIATLLRMDLDHYGQLLNVIAHDLIRQFGKSGVADAETKIISDIGIADTSIFVLPDEAMNELDAKTSKSLVATLKYWKKRFVHLLGDDFSIVADQATIEGLCGRLTKNAQRMPELANIA